jgi:hypothetical protein
MSASVSPAKEITCKYVCGVPGTHSEREAVSLFIIKIYYKRFFKNPSENTTCEK